MSVRRFNSPPGWPQPPEGWTPPPGWTPDPSWPDPPEGWELWIGSVDEADGSSLQESVLESDGPQPEPLVHPPVVETQDRIDPPAQISATESSLVDMSDEHVLQSVGIYRYHHPLENAVAFKERLASLDERIKQIIKDGRAIEVSTMFTFDNSLAKGRRMTGDLSKLMLRAYNAEAENCVSKLRLANVVTAKTRLNKSREHIAKLGQMMEMRISDEFHAMRIEEIELTADWLMKKQEEKEAARDERARLREERRAQKELEEERERLAKEVEHLQNVAAELEAQGEDSTWLREKLTELEDAIEQNDYRRANIRAGYVYVISNRGAFGHNVVKIGLTRRLEPYDRIRELGGASVPFRFDVHALFFSEDAVSLETELHHYFADRAVNRVNSRKEFFFASPAEVRTVLAERIGNLLEFSEQADATEYFQSLSAWPEERRAA